MTSIDRNPLDIQDENTRRLSEFLFGHYHTKMGGTPATGRHSRVSDRLAVNLAGNQDAIFELSNLLARSIMPDLPGEVVGFFVKPERPKSILEALMEGLAPSDPLEGIPLIGPMGIEPLALWHRTALYLENVMGFEDVSFDHQYAEVEDDRYRPGIHGDGIDVAVVNGALINVILEQAPMHLENVGNWLATHQDEDGWVFSRALCEEFEPDA